MNKILLLFGVASAIGLFYFLYNYIKQNGILDLISFSFIGFSLFIISGFAYASLTTEG